MLKLRVPQVPNDWVYEPSVLVFFAVSGCGLEIPCTAHAPGRGSLGLACAVAYNRTRP